MWPSTIIHAIIIFIKDKGYDSSHVFFIYKDKGIFKG